MTFYGTNHSNFIATPKIIQSILPYEVTSNDEGYWCVKGPGAYGYYGGYLNKVANIEDLAVAYQIADHMRQSYEAGRLEQQRIIKNALGL